MSYKSQKNQIRKYSRNSSSESSHRDTFSESIIVYFRPQILRRYLERQRQREYWQMFQAFKLLSKSQEDCLAEEQQQFAEYLYFHQRLGRIKANSLVKSLIYRQLCLHRVLARQQQIQKAVLFAIPYLHASFVSFLRSYQKLKSTFQLGRRTNDYLGSSSLNQSVRNLKLNNQAIKKLNALRITTQTLQKVCKSTQKSVFDLIGFSNEQHEDKQKINRKLNYSVACKKIEALLFKSCLQFFNRTEQQSIVESRDNSQIFTNILRNTCFLSQQRSHNALKKDSYQVEKSKLMKLKLLVRKKQKRYQQEKVQAFRKWRYLNAFPKVEIAAQIRELEQMRQKLLENCS